MAVPDQTGTTAGLPGHYAGYCNWVAMRQNQIRSVVLLGAISIIGIIGMQVYFLLEAWNIKEKQLHQSVVIALSSVAEKMSRLNNPASSVINPVKQVSPDYFVVDVNSIIDANVLEYYLKNEFHRMNIRTDYEYAIYDCHNDKMVYGNYITADGSDKPVEMTSTLPKYDQYMYYFGIRFPGIRNTLAGNMTLWFFLTVILLVSIVFFVYAIFVILQQKRGSEMQKDFINNMTHEFKTPLSSINIAADVLLQPGISNDQQRLNSYASVIKQENTRIIQQVEKVLQIARMERQGVSLKLESIDLNQLAETVADTFRTNHNGVAITAALDPAIEPVRADALHMTNILFNLVDNAVKYSGERPEITIRTQARHRGVVLVIADKGPGIPVKYQRQVFKKFFRVPSGNIHDVKGFGLGLYYVRNVCTAHGWNIRLESRQGEGTTFLIDIPLKKSKA